MYYLVSFETKALKTTPTWIDIQNAQYFGTKEGTPIGLLMTRLPRDAHVKPSKGMSLLWKPLAKISSPGIVKILTVDDSSNWNKGVR